MIPPNDEAWAAVVALKKSADGLQTYAPENFIFYREWPKSDGTKPMGRGGWRTAWRNLREDAAKGDKKKNKPEMARLARLRFYDVRHQFVTELCEAGIPESVIRELAGHVDPQMMRIYSHPRLAAKRLAVEALGTLKPAPGKRGYVTKHVTKALPKARGEMQVLEKNGRGAQI